MPELPEVEIVKRGLERACVGKTIRTVTINRADLRVPVPQDFKTVLQGQRIKQFQRRGKYILAMLDSDHAFVLHLGMSGRIHIHDSAADYKQGPHDHASFEMEDGKLIIFSDPRRFGMLYTVPVNEWQKQAPFSQMGPEPLGNDFSGPVLAAKLKGRKAPIKAALLDQKIVAGIGNIYACEALYDSGISPNRSAHTVQGARAEKLSGAIRRVLERAIKSGGSTLRDYQHTDGSLGYFQYDFSVYDREGRSCPGCECDILKTGGVNRITQSGRSTFYCPRKQK